MKAFNKKELITKRLIKRVVLHCSATREGQDIKTETIKGWHVNDRKWSDIGYHFVIELDGSINLGRDINRTGSHAKGFNTGSIGICYVGGCTKDMKPKDTKTKEQNTSLAALLIHIYDMYGKIEVVGHCDLPGVKKDCPSFDVKEFTGHIESYLFE